MTEVELVVDSQAILGEGPCWHVRSQSLFWVDIDGASVHRYDPASGQDRSIPVGASVGCLTPRASGGILLARKNDFAGLDLESQTVTPLVTVSEPPGNRFNDGRCDPVGRFWAGTMDNNCRDGAGILYRLDPDLSLHAMVPGVSISNGLAWSLDGTVLYYVDSPTQCVAAYDYDLATGAIHNRRVAVEIAPVLGAPDGMTIDAEGMLWIALWDGWSVGRWDPVSGRLLERIKLPAPRVTACAFGGPDLDDLYITCARQGMDEKALGAAPLSGGLFRCRPGVRGVASVEFDG
jgi:sugar lactone lactonase YvrE